jgi:leucyl aminopeptidase (aminopeptidase T)
MEGNMELVLGTEPTQEYYAFELLAAARKLLQDIMLVQPGEGVAVTVDTAGDWRVALATAQAVYALDAEPTLLLYQTQPDAQMEPPAPVAGAVAEADVWIEYAVQYILYTKARRKASEAGCRYACMAGMDVDALVRTIGRVDYPTLMALGDELVRLINKAQEIRVTSREGTDLIGRLAGGAFQPGGVAKEKGVSIMLGGQVGHLPEEETIEGKIVVDGVIWPPAEIGVLKETVELVVDKGLLKEVLGSGAADTFRSWLASFDDPNMYRMAHYAYGFNPGVSRLTGRIVEDERVFGSLTFGFGRNAASHTDCLVLRPTVYLDGVEIEREGKYVHPDLVRLCQELRVPGY